MAVDDGIHKRHNGDLATFSLGSTALPFCVSSHPCALFLLYKTSTLQKNAGGLLISRRGARV